MSDDVTMPPLPSAGEIAAAQAAAEKAQAEAVAAMLAAMAEDAANAEPIDLPPVDIVPAPKGSFGPTFLAELAAAGVATLPFVVHPDSVMFSLGISAKNRAKVVAVIKAHDPAARPAVDLAAYTSAAHAALRDGGVTIGGLRIKTDSESRGLIDGAYALSQAQPDAALDFKAASGWVTIDAATMQTVAVAVGRWVQACYTAYRLVDGKVADGTFTTTAQVDAAFAAVTLPG